MANFNRTKGFTALASILAGVLLYGLSVMPAFADAALDAIQSSKVLRVGVVQYEPFAVKDTQTSELKGFSVDTADLLAKEMNVKYELVETTWATAIAGLQANKYDVVLTPLKRTIQRSMSVSFTEPYVELTEYAMVRDDSGVSSWADIDQDGKAIAAVLGGASYLKLQAGKGEFIQHGSLSPFDDESLCGSALGGGQVVAWVEDQVSLMQYANAHPDIKFRMIKVPFSALGEGIGYAVKQGNSDLLNTLNIFVDKLRNDGTYVTLADKWKLPHSIIVNGMSMRD